ncbi:hypothetical protein B7P34_12045 [Streptosporangium nondiastaticum]|uniref:Protein-L-isoaspartate(D-aspartate) O-methyltransferase n=1 Tax=Streptosporangium nondiastaticum TaxID=35764 RepID=A0A9X7JRP6_9ACTN|nr:hypothetical protein [Streptosporangium nondiastaticum]PSJ28468.1 hypothetical protein B7P34_12045 [Streptosporangium nondiastaticum]
MTVSRNGTASGRFVHTASYMWLRSHRGPNGKPPQLGEPRCSASTAAPNQVLDDSLHATFAIGLQIPGLTMRRAGAGDDRRILLWDGHESFASVYCEGWNDPDAVLQQGPRSLWSEITSARTWWEETGRPELTRFGVSVDGAGRHHVWLDSPDTVVRSPNMVRSHT